MMDLEGGQTSKRDDEKPMEGLSRHLHHSLNLNKVIIWMTALVIAADVFIVLYRSGYPNSPSLPTSRDSKEYSFASQSFSFGQAKNVSSSSSTTSGDHSCSANRSSPNPQVDKDSEKTKLERVLCKAATVDKTVIFTAANAAWTSPGSLIDLFLEGFRIGDQTISLLNHLVIVAMDQKAYSRCLEVHQHCYALTTEGVNFSGEAHFMSEQYLKMMWRRLDFMRTILELGYNFIFTDSDILWLRNPFPRFYEDADFQIASDEYRFNSTDPNNKSNAGFIYVRSNNKTLQFYNFWYWSKDTYPGKNEQDVFNRLKKNPFISEIGLKMRFLDTEYFSGFCQPSKDLNVVCTMHANCCYGIRNKIHDLQRVIDDWRDYRESPRNSTNPYPWAFAKKYCA
ncbi:uncharacterized protein At4g15970-like [Coffea arabica]|uniref:Uncharacterized protein At4g15970-like n=1 Tax=Coffea arabica TaxID=13443 RepID=A0A6P6SPL4_COFAR